jgi:hypothetical protein
LIPKSPGDLVGDSDRTEEGRGRGGIWIFNWDPKSTIRLCDLLSFESQNSSVISSSTMPKPTPRESNLSKWVLASDFGDFWFVVWESDQNGFLKQEKILESRVEVGLSTDSVVSGLLLNPFEPKPANNLGERKIDDVGFG